MCIIYIWSFQWDWDPRTRTDWCWTWTMIVDSHHCPPAPLPHHQPRPPQRLRQSHPPTMTVTVTRTRSANRSGDPRLLDGSRPRGSWPLRAGSTRCLRPRPGSARSARLARPRGHSCRRRWTDSSPSWAAPGRPLSGFMTGRRRWKNGEKLSFKNLVFR